MMVVVGGQVQEGGLEDGRGRRFVPENRLVEVGMVVEVAGKVAGLVVEREGMMEFQAVLVALAVRNRADLVGMEIEKGNQMVGMAAVRIQVVLAAIVN